MFFSPASVNFSEEWWNYSVNHQHIYVSRWSFPAWPSEQCSSKPVCLFSVCLEQRWLAVSAMLVMQSSCRCCATRDFHAMVLPLPALATSALSFQTLLMHMIKSAFLFFPSVMTEIRSGWLGAAFLWGNGVSSQWGEGLKDITCYISLVAAFPINWVQCDLVEAKLGTIYGCCQGFDVMACFAQRQITCDHYF